MPMNYTILKTIIETSLSQYTCQSCHMKLEENALNITGVSDWAVDFLVICPHCQAEAHMHAEVGTAQFNTNNQPIEPTQNKQIILKNTNAIKESDIADFEKNIIEKNSIEDLLK